MTLISKLALIFSQYTYNRYDYIEERVPTSGHRAGIN